MRVTTGIETGGSIRKRKPTFKSVIVKPLKEIFVDPIVEAHSALVLEAESFVAERETNRREKQLINMAEDKYGVGCLEASILTKYPTEEELVDVIIDIASKMGAKPGANIKQKVLSKQLGEVKLAHFVATVFNYTNS